MVGREEMAALDKAVGLALRTKRERRGWTLEVMASRVGLSLSVLHSLENGHRSATVRELIGLCGVLDVAPDGLIVAALREALPMGWPGREAGGREEPA